MANTDAQLTRIEALQQRLRQSLLDEHNLELERLTLECGARLGQLARQCADGVFPAADLPRLQAILAQHSELIELVARQLPPLRTELRKAAQCRRLAAGYRAGLGRDTGRGQSPGVTV